MSGRDDPIERPRLADELGSVRPVLAVAALMWILEFVDLVPGVNLDRFGIEPRSVDGLVGIPLAPLLHAGFGHLIGNTLPFVILGVVIAIGGVRRWWEVTIIVTLCAGIGTWLFGRSGTEHIGASGVVFGYLTYLIGRGFIARRVTWIVGGIVVAMVYGGLLWGLLPRPGISFTGHLFGAVGGIVAAWLMHATTNDEPLSS